jgi:hypothetical protein
VPILAKTSPQVARRNTDIVNPMNATGRSVAARRKSDVFGAKQFAAPHRKRFTRHIVLRLAAASRKLPASPHPCYRPAVAKQKLSNPSDKSRHAGRNAEL